MSNPLTPASSVDAKENRQSPRDPLSRHEDWWDCLRLSGSVLAGYLAMGGAFGVVFVNQGHHWTGAILMGFLVYAGAAQFLSVSLLAAEASLIDIFVSIFLLNFRHVFYGLALEKRLRNLTVGQRLYSLFTLSDETFGLLAANQKSCSVADRRTVFGVSALNHFFWVAGCGIGALLGKNLPFSTNGLEFSLTALFAVLFLEKWKKNRNYLAICFAAFAGLVGLVVWSGKAFLPVAIGLCTLAILIKGQSNKASLDSERSNSTSCQPLEKAP